MLLENGPRSRLKLQKRRHAHLAQFIGSSPRFCDACSQGVLFSSEMLLLVCELCRTCRWLCARCMLKGRRLAPFIGLAANRGHRTDDCSLVRKIVQARQ
jgi:hypothetical protein